MNARAIKKRVHRYPWGRWALRIAGVSEETLRQCRALREKQR